MGPELFIKFEYIKQIGDDGLTRKYTLKFNPTEK